MKIVILALLLVPCSFAQCANEVKAYLVSGISGNNLDVITKWIEPVPFVYVGVALNVNAKVIFIDDLNLKNNACDWPNHLSRLYYFRTTTIINKGKMLISVRFPCLSPMTHKAKLRVTIITADHKRYVDTIHFEGIWTYRY